MDGHYIPNKINHLISSEPNSLTININRNKKPFITRNRFEVLSTTEPIEADTIISNPDAIENNLEANNLQEKITHLPPPIIIKGLKDCMFTL